MSAAGFIEKLRSLVGGASQAPPDPVSAEHAREHHEFILGETSGSP